MDYASMPNVKAQMTNKAQMSKFEYLTLGFWISFGIFNLGFVIYESCINVNIIIDQMTSELNT